MTYIGSFGAVVTFYAHAFLQEPASKLTPAITAIVAICLIVIGLFGVSGLTSIREGTSARKISSWLMLLSIILGIISTIFGAVRHSMAASDWGIFTIQIVTPVALYLSVNRISFLRKICRIALVFSLVDFAFNSVSFLGLADLVHISGSTNTPYGIHYLGLPGNSFAEGLVAFIAISYVAAGFARTKNRTEQSLRLLLMAVLFSSEVLMRARVDLGISALAVFLLITPKSHQFSMIAVSLVTSLLFLCATFLGNPYNTDETLRASLLKRGFQKALHNIFLGEGIRYRSTADLVSDYRSLNAAGVTESGALDYAIAYGIPSVLFLYASAFFALGAGRNRQTLPAVLLCCLTGSLAITGGLTSFLGSIVFYLALIICQKEEWWIVQTTAATL